MSASEHDCVGALLVRGDQVLLGRRSSDCEWLAGAWDLFGGHIEAGEDEEAALCRELREELGIVALQFRYLETIAGVSAEPWRLSVFVVTQWQGELRNCQPEEHAEMRWCTLEEAQQRLSSAHPDFSRLLAQAMSTV